MTAPDVTSFLHSGAFWCCYVCRSSFAVQSPGFRISNPVSQQDQSAARQTDTSVAPGDSQPAVRLSARSLGVLVLLAHVPLLIKHFVDLYRFRPHYEFVPFLIIAAVWILRKRWPTEPAIHTRWTRWGGNGLLLAGVLVLAGGTVLYSPFLATVAAMLSTGGLILLLAGRAAWRNLMPVWCLLWLTIPPPFMLDATLIRHLQTLTSRTSGALLNWFGVLHLQAGNVIRLPDRSLFVAEACSGVHSQFVLIAVSAIIAVVKRHPWIHVLGLMGAAVFWSVTCNVARVTTVVWAASKGVDLAAGWQHEVLGYSLILAGFFCLIGTDHLLSFLGGAMPLPAEDPFSAENFPSDDLPVWIRLDRFAYRIWNFWIAGQRSVPAAEETNVSTASTSFRPRQLIPLTLAFVVLGGAQIAVALATPGGQEVDGSALLAETDENTMPAVLGDWKRFHHGSETRDVSSDTGHYSRYWVYRNDSSSIQYSMDFPFVGWHDLTGCYEGQGWHVDQRNVREDSAGQQYAQVQLSRPTGEIALLCFSLHSADGEALDPDSRVMSFARKLNSNPLISQLRGEQVVAPSQMSVQFQQLQVMPSMPSTNDIVDSARAFEQARSHWLGAAIPSLSGSG